ncbi:MAG: PKD domain-containing protein [Bacteroidota bacterium]
MKNSTFTKLFYWAMILGSFAFLSACNDDEEISQDEALSDLEISLEVSEGTIKAGDNVTYAIEGLDPEGISYAWAFAGGEPATSTDPEPVVTYSEAGTYGASLVVTRSADEKTFEASLENAVTVEALAAGDVLASFTSDVKVVEENGVVTYTSSSTDGATLAWTFEGGTPGTSTAAEVKVTYETAGNWDVTLVATKDGVSDTKESADYVTVNAVVVETVTADFSASSTTIQKGTSVTFTNKSTDGATLEWAFEGGDPETSTEAEVEVTYETAGTWDVTLIATKDGTSTTKKMEDFITVLPPAEFQTGFISVTGKVISLKFDQPLNDPSGEQANMLVSVGGGPVGISSLALATGDNTTVEVTLDNVVAVSQEISIDFDPNSITTTNGGGVTPMDDEIIPNTYFDGGILTAGGASGNFDTGIEGWRTDVIKHDPDNDPDNDQARGVTVSHDPTGGRNGTGALKVVMNENTDLTGTNKNNFFILTNNIITLEAGKTYEVDMWYKIVGKPGFAEATIRLKNANGANPEPEQKVFISGDGGATGFWRQKNTINNFVKTGSGSLPVAATVNDGTVTIQLIGKASANDGGESVTVYFDDIKITEIP